MSKLYIYPSIVQGELAPRNLIKQLKRINKDAIVDVILIVRGGGSLQDLMAFNDEDLVREISASSIPTITGIGHKPDVTLADYASDSSQETPTAAAIQSVPDFQTLKQDIHYIEIALIKVGNNLITSLQNKLKGFLTIVKISRPIKIISDISKEFAQKRKLLNKVIDNKIKINNKYLHDYKDRQIRLVKEISINIDDYYNDINKLYKNIKKNLNSNIISRKEILNLKVQQIKQINPSLLLTKGYAIVRDKNNKIVKSINDVALQCELEIQVCDGLIKVKRKE